VTTELDSDMKLLAAVEDEAARDMNWSATTLDDAYILVAFVVVT
jgi:hypothetical protein